MKTSINAKNWLKFNLNVLDTYVNSVILEFTWFEIQPINTHFFISEADNILDLFKMFKSNEFDAHISLSYYLDAMSLKLYNVKYPTFCTVELSALIKSKEYIHCGYDGDFSRVQPLYAQDPNIFYSMLRYEAPKVFGIHEMVKLDYQEIMEKISTPLSYSKS